MALRDWIPRRTPLQLALERGNKSGADLAAELRKLGDYMIKSEADAEAVCDLLAKLATQGLTVGGNSALHALAGLFQHVDGTECPAFAIMAEQGNRFLVQIVDSALQDEALHDGTDLLFALKILALYGTREGTEAVLRAARRPLRPDDYMWSVILSVYTNDHPEREWLFQELSNPLPTGFLAVSLLDSANTAHRNGASDAHPFDSPAGIQQLAHWLTDDDEERFSYAVSAANALPFLTSHQRDALLSLALDHASVEVQLESAWVAAKLGREAGIRWLARSCYDVSLSARAKQYLEELGRADAIPAESKDASFEAQAEFAQWLAHPSELGRPPDELEIVDHRELEWPPKQEPKSLWLIKYRVKDGTGLKEDDVDVGLVGSITFCLLSYKLGERPPEDAYAIHCYWEMAGVDLITEADVPANSTEYDAMMSQSTLSGISDPQIIAVAELSPELKYPQSLVALAKATRDGECGWLVLDGGRSRWYAATEMPPEVPDKTVLMVHVGRTLLGFREEPDRRNYLRRVALNRPPHQIILAYEQLLDKARTDTSQAKKLLRNPSVLGSMFTDYVSALVAVRSGLEADNTCAAYESLLAAALHAEPSFHGEIFDCFSALGQIFDRYIDGLIELNRHAEVAALVEKLRPNWDHNLGYGKLGCAAFKSGHDQLAESLLMQLRHSSKDWCRSDTMNSLAEIWCNWGRREDAHSLLIDALNALLEQSHLATGSDCELFEGWFQKRRSAYLRLFPDRGAEELERRRIPASTLTLKS